MGEISRDLEDALDAIKTKSPRNETPKVLAEVRKLSAESAEAAKKEEHAGWDEAIAKAKEKILAAGSGPKETPKKAEEAKEMDIDVSDLN